MDILKDIQIDEASKNTLIERINAEINTQSTANTEKALDSVTKFFFEKTGIERTAEDKNYNDYFNKIVKEYPTKVTTSIKTEYDAKISEYEKNMADLKTKLDSGITDEKTKKEILDLRNKTAEFHKITEEKEKEWKNKLTEKEKENYQYKLNTEIRLSTPAYDIKNNNPFEVDAKNREAIQNIMEENSVKLNEKGELICENKKDYRQRLFKDLLTEKMTNYLPKDITVIGQNAPNKPVNAKLNTQGLTEEEKRKVRESFLKEKGIDLYHSNYGAEMNKLIREELGLK